MRRKPWAAYNGPGFGSAPLGVPPKLANKLTPNRRGCEPLGRFELVHGGLIAAARNMTRAEQQYPPIFWASLIRPRRTGWRRAPRLPPLPLPPRRRPW